MTAFQLPPSELPQRLVGHTETGQTNSGKWPGWLRVTFIFGMSAALWAGIIYGFLALIG